MGNVLIRVIRSGLVCTALAVASLGAAAGPGQTTATRAAEAVHTSAPVVAAPAVAVTTGTLRAALDLWREFIGREAARRAALCDEYREVSGTTPTIYRRLGPPEHFAESGEVTLVQPGTPEEVPVLPWRECADRRPQGALSSKIIYCSGGHGWTCDNTSSALWYTQRPASYGIVEDYGNLDQLNLFADAAWRAGATVVAFRPLGNQPIERIVDNSDERHVRFDGAWYDSQSPIYFGAAFDAVPYRYAPVQTTETARARYQPYLPKDDYYPVYTWARDGADRVPQLYRIRHAGGLSEVRIDHRRVGKGWVFLGEYYFQRGSNGFVEVSNLVDDPGLADGRHVVIADAIRFGNGRGDVNRGGGISGFLREEEAARYWVERMLPVSAPPIFDPFESSDQDSNVGAPPRMAAFMNRERAGGFFDRIFLSFHTNAAGGRGAVGLFNKDPDRRPDGQAELAELIARQLNEDMLTTSAIHWPAMWTVRKKLTDSHINFGEIRRDAIANEMCATIIELAFHDNAEDAMLIRDPQFRQFVAESALKAITRFFATDKALAQPVELMPAPPVLVAATALTSSSVRLDWAPSEPLPTQSHLITSYKIARSTDGFAFDGAVDVGMTTAIVVCDLPAGQPHFFRVCAVNRGGESRPSAVLGARCSGQTTASRHLLAYGFTTFSEDVVLTQTAPAGLGSPLHRGGEFVRIIPRRMNARNYVAHWGSAIAEAGRDFDSCDMTALRRLDLSPTSYTSVMLLLGKQSPAENPLDQALVRKLDDFRRRGGGVLVSGTNVVQCLQRAFPQEASAKARKSRSQRPVWLPSATTESLALKSVAGVARSAFEGFDAGLDTGEGDAYPATGCDTLRVRDGRPLIDTGANAWKGTLMALVPSAGKTGACVLAGFPIETIQPAQQRTDFMTRLLPLMEPKAAGVRAEVVRREGSRAKRHTR